MQIGLLLNTELSSDGNPAVRLQELLRQTQAARGSGFDIITVPHHYSRGPTQWLPPLLTLAYLAQEAGPMWMGTTVYLLSMAHPVALAEEVSMCDSLSGGRFIFGVGLGWRPEEFSALGLSIDTRAGRFEEALEILSCLWRGEVVRYHGRFFSLDGVQMVLKPTQNPRPPIWIGANASARSVRRAAQLGDGWVISSHIDFEAVKRLAQVYSGEFSRSGKPRGTIALLRNFFMSDTAEAALQEIRRSFELTYRTYGEWGLFEDVLRLEERVLTGEALVRGRIIVGGPDECVGQIAEYSRHVPIDYLILRMDWPGMPSALVEECIHRVGEQLLPKLRQSLRGGSPRPAPKPLGSVQS